MKRIVSILCLSLFLGFVAFQYTPHNVLSQFIPHKNTIKISGTIAFESKNDLITDSSVIIRGNVREILPSKWSNPEMKKGENVRNILQTDVLVDINDIFKGKPYDPDNIRVRIYRGYSDDAVVYSDGYPNFSSGEEVILFLSPDDSDVAEKNENYYVLTGMIQGKYLLMDDTETTNKVFISCAPASNEKILLSEFKDEIARELLYQQEHPKRKMTLEEIRKNNEAVLGK